MDVLSWLVPSATLCSMLSCKVLVLKSGPAVQLSTTEGNSYYVGTKLDAFVYDTLNAWYQEDMNTVSAKSHWQT